ncbi:MAG: PRC-barrel domain-containing protein [Gemmatimonadaceae bacterium]
MAKKQHRPGAKDAAGIGPYARERERLVPMSRLKGWNVQKGEADIRSWEVRTVSGRVLGHVRELLVDPNAGEVVMIDVDLAGTDRHASIPLRVVELDRARRVVRADSSDMQGSDSDDAESDDHTRDEEASRLDARDVRYADSSSERVVERRPIVEETVVRRRDASDTDHPDPESRL